MPKEAGLRISLYLLAIVLLGALAMPASFAEEAGSGASAERGSSQPPSNKDAAGEAVKLDNRPAPEGDDSRAPKKEEPFKGTEAPPKNVNAPVLDGPNPDGIDTRITVQPRRLGDRFNKVGEAKGRLESPPVRNFHRRTLSISGASNPVRNAIGMPVTRHEDLRHEDLRRRDGEPFSSRPGAQVPAVAAGVTPGAAGGLAKTDEGFGRPPILKPNASPIVSPAALNRGTINGTSQIRPRVGPSRVGGPAKTVGGINGTTIRPPH